MKTLFTICCFCCIYGVSEARDEVGRDYSFYQDVPCEITSTWDVYSQEGTISLSVAQENIFYEAWSGGKMINRVLGRGQSIAFANLKNQGIYLIYAKDPTNYEQTRLIGEVELVEPVPEDVQPTSNTNWIKTKTYTYQDNSQPYVIDVSYFNGLGYLDQTVNVKASAGAKSDIITLMSYDCHYHDDARTYLPYSSQNLSESGKRDPNASDNQCQFYTQKFGEDDGNYAFFEKNYNSPSNNYQIQINVGMAFRAGNGKTVNLSKEGNTVEDKVYIIDFSRVSRDSSRYEIKKFYPAGTLYKDIEIAEDGQKKMTFTDKLGHVILERVELNVGNQDTYYVYDEFGRLALVVPPIMASMLSFITIPVKYLTDEYTRVSCYYYMYDGHGNIIRKHTPGRKNDEFMEYDNRSRLTKYSNGNYTLKTGKEAAKDSYETFWQLYKYDDLNRLVETKLARVEANGTQRISTDTVLMSSYKYDIRVVESDTFVEEAGIVSSQDYNPYVKGQKVWENLLIITSDMMKNPQYVKQHLSYDNKYRVIQMTREGADYPKTRISTRYGYPGLPLARREAYDIRGGSGKSSRISDLDTHYTYDNRGRLMSEIIVLDENDTTQIDYSYDPLGKLISKNQDGIIETYDYNIQGWRISQKHPYFSADLIYYDSITYKGYHTGLIKEWSWKHRGDNTPNRYVFNYLNNRLKSASHYFGNSPGGFSESSITYDVEGNIKTLQRDANGEAEKYRYIYDFRTGGLQHLNKVNKLSLYLSDNFEEIRPVSERIIAPQSDSYGPLGIVGSWTSMVVPDINSCLLSGEMYQYDVNSNVIYDPQRKLNIRYNCLNLTETVIRDSTDFVNYSYLADGTKWKVADNSGNGFIYQGSFKHKLTNGASTLLSAAFPTGTFNITQNNNSRNVEKNYYCTDHLGSVRVVYTADGNIKEQNDYYPFGSRWELPDSPISDNVLRFNGKEQQVTGNVNYLDFGARMYDSHIGRWLTQDPMAEKYYSANPFVYCVNNPINAIDPDGSLIIFINGFTPNKREQASANYWGGIDNAVMKQLKDMNAQYRHGGGSSSVPHRRLYGAMQAYVDFDKIINAISDETGAITETIKIVTHSMGAAYGKGYVAELKKQLKKRGYDKKVLITLVADFDPYQADALYRDSQIKTQQFTHKGIMADQKQRNLSDDDYYEDRRKSNHSIRSFYDDIFKLREGTYVWDGTQWLLQN